MAISTKDLQRLFVLIADDIAANRDHLCELDGVIGDGDHGLAMDAGCEAAAKAVGALDPAQTAPTAAFNAAAKAFLNAVGASSGPLYATAFMRAGAAVKDKSDLSDDDFRRAFAAMAQGIQERGKAEPGEKTMVDTWRPAADAALAPASGTSLSEALDMAERAARQGSEATRNMTAAKGRASRLGERVIGHIDPGAASAAIIIASIAKFAREHNG
ncbi:dihydroxyacetone kinase subunit L [Rhizobium bangladeshense]|uniref:Dihydroxyacetone kinase subunit L n=1 Tax=Rhizobium bangladeshense TaxID=1138189 RepID=A0ABS7LJE0_9HYPH|nr:dihydroxyacetone kinase subunit DhaL [Rhizobium bangladeshense]MBX4867297.1 dihydroxyacetone kinase subunit L [Rhizobium bangladeshense]MBX4871588.1 dihydroxyacetone kinase subunit L [Rhizobium bangladeshense]MBX4882902.1 dihydroxyacetone kinase subunit L [Rhizobium bangladeshense]MBX4896930.1 dihydroxyacetone kinase subunit L [Rhizobium bangladeshense]MBY3591116.1 dihydroxyacetone kinase subunit L [Rhizobium bangladeshense]